MAKFEVLIPSADGTKSTVVTAEGQDWFVGLETALSGRGLADCMKNIICDVKEDGGIYVTDTASGRRFFLREIDDSQPQTDIRKVVKLEKIAPVAADVSKNDRIADLFFEVSGAQGKPMQEGIDFFLDLALKYVPCESGSFARSDLSTTDMEFVSCRGPKADSVVGIKVRVGQGFVGFSAKHNCFIAVGDVHKDPRFYKTISQNIGYETSSIVCAPIKSSETNITFGVLELINRKGSSRINAEDMEILRIISDQMAEYFHAIWTGTNNTFEE